MVSLGFGDAVCIDAGACASFIESAASFAQCQR
jgi:hypothetical protein